MFDELKNSWKKQEGNNMPSVEEISKLIKGNGSRMFMMNVLTIFLLLFAVLVLFMIKYFIPFPNPITEYAIVAIIIVIIIASAYLFNLTRSFPQNMDESKDVKRYIKDWIEYQEQIKKYSNLFIPFYISAITIAISIYMWDFTADNNLVRIIVYSLTLGWIGYAWFVLGPKSQKGIDQKIDDIIDGYKRIGEQLK